DLDFDTTIHMYYGNTTVSSLSNGTATFIFFDDYENNNLDRWDETTGAGFSCATDQVVHGTYALKFQSTPGADIMKNLTETGEPLTHDFMVHSWVRDDNQIRGGHAPLVKSQSQFWVYACRGYNSQFSYLQDAANYVPWPQNSVGGSDEWFEINVGLSMSTDVMRAWKNEFYMGEIDLIASNGASVPDDLFQIGYGQQSSYVTWWDDTFVRKWVVNEPSHGAWDGTSTVSWHHDCSDTTGFVYNDTWNMNWMPWTIQSGALTSDGSYLSVTSVVTGSGWHGPVFEYELPQTLRVRDINNYSAIFDVDNSLISYTGYEVLMLGDADRNPVIFFSFHDGWAGSCQGSYGVAYVFTNGSYVGYGSGYPVGWTSFSGIMNASYTEAGLLAYVDGIGQDILPGLTEADFDREIKYVAVASARYGSDPLIPVHIDEIYLNYEIPSEPPVQASINDVEDFWYEASESGNVIEWTVANFNPTSYELWRDEGLLTSEAWPGGTTIEFDINNLSPGEYNYTIVVYGDFDVVVSDTVIVTVMDLTIPSLGHPSDVVYEYGTTGHAIIWSVSDLYPDVYAITQDVSVVANDFWTSGSIILDIDGLAIGEYTYAIMISDTSFNIALDTVTVTVVDTTAPILNHPTDIIGNIASTSIQISWQPTDLLPFNYAIFENGTQVDSGTWTSGEYLNYTLDDLTLSSYNVTIVVWDTSGNYARDTVLVNIEEGSIQPIGDYLVVTISIGSIGVIVVIVGLICRNKGGVQSGPPDSGYSW
ncbi:MAG: DUF2341 domain-containing protein, partial [Candidatus Thorarchaeota archaeon]